MQPFPWAPTQDDLTHAVLSDAVYSGIDPSLGSQSWQRVDKYLTRDDIKQTIGTGWHVVVDNKRHLSSQDAVVVENKALGKVVILCRGTRFLFRDVLVNDIGGFFGLGSRVSSTLSSVGDDARDYAQRHGYVLSAAGHPLGGSVAEAVAGVLGVYCYTFNSPQLRHTFGDEYTDARSANSHNVRAWRLDADIISPLGGLPIDSRNNHTISLHSPTRNPIEAHRMTALLEQMLKANPGMSLTGLDSTGAHIRVPVKLVLDKRYTEKSFEGDFTWKKDYVQVDGCGYKDVTMSQTSKGYEATSAFVAIDYLRTVHRLEEGNLFYTKITSSYSVEDRETHKLVFSEVETEYKLSMHVVSAVASSRVAFVNGALAGLLGKDTSLHLRPLFASTAESFGKTWLTSVTASQLDHLLTSHPVPGCGGMGSLIAQAGIDGAFAYIHGDHEAALRIALDSLASAALTHFTGLSYHTTNQVFTGQLFGTGMIYSRETARELGFSGTLPGGLHELLGQTGVGLMANHISDVYRLSSGQIVQREASGVGVFAKTSVFGGSVGLYRGVELYRPFTKQYTDATGHAIVRTEMGQKSFSGQFIARLSVCNRVASLSLGPAWHSVTETMYEEHRADDTPFYELSGLPNQYLSNGPSEASGLSTREEYQNALITGAELRAGYSGNSLSPGALHGGATSAPSVPALEGASFDLVSESVQPTAIQTSSAIGFSNHKADHELLLTGQGRTISIMSHQHYKRVEKHGLSKRVTELDQDSGKDTEKHTTQQTVAEGHKLTTTTTAVVRTQDFVSTVHESDKSYTVGIRHKSHEKWYDVNQKRTNGAVNTTSDQLTSEYTDDGSNLSTSDICTTDTQHVTRDVQERLTYTHIDSSGTQSTMFEDALITSTTDAGTTSVDAGTKTTSHHIVDVAYDQVTDKMFESKNGQVVQYAQGEKRESCEHVGDVHIDDAITTNTDATTKISVGHKAGIAARNGIEGEATMDVYADQHTVISSSLLQRNPSNPLSTEKVISEVVTDHALGTFAITNEGEVYKATAPDLPPTMRSEAGSGITFSGVPITVTSQVNLTVAGTASSTTQIEGVVYAPGEKDVKLESTVLVKQTINTYIAEDNSKPLLTENEQSRCISKTEDECSGDYYTRADDITTQQLDVSAKTGDPGKQISDLADLAVEDGGSLDPDKHTNPNGVQGDVVRTRILSGVHVERHHHHSASLAISGATVDDTYTDTYSSASKSQTIESGSADNAVLCGEATVTYDSPSQVSTRHITHELKFFSTSTKVTTETFTTDLKDNTQSKHESTSKLMPSPGIVRFTAGLCGGLITIAADCLERGQCPDSKTVCNLCISLAEGATIGQILAVAQLVESTALGLGGVVGVAAVAAMLRLAVETYFPSNAPGALEIPQSVNITASIATSSLQALAALNFVQILALTGETVGVLFMMAVPLVVDIFKIGYLMYEGILSREKGLEMLCNRATSLATGGLASWGATALITTALGAGAATASGVLIVASIGAVTFSITAYSFGKMSDYLWWKVNTTRRVAELRKILELDTDCTSKTQLDRARRLLARKHHTDLGGDKEVFQAVLKDMEELIALETALGTYQHLTIEEGEKVVSWTGFWFLVMRIFQDVYPESTMELGLLSCEAYEYGKQRELREKKESKKSK